MMNQNNSRTLPYETLSRALSGDEASTEKVYEYYEPYIITLSKIPYVNVNGNIKYRIDEDIYMNLKLKLFEVLQTFKIA